MNIRSFKSFLHLLLVFPLCVFADDYPAQPQDFHITASMAGGTDSQDRISVTLPANQDGWRIIVQSDVNSTARLVDASDSSISYSSSKTSHALFIPPEDLVGGNTYTLEVESASNVAMNYTAAGDPNYVRTLTWEPGLEVPTVKQTTPTTSGGFSGGGVLYKLTAQNSVHGAMRFALNAAGSQREVDLYIRKNSPPTTNSYNYHSITAGSDGVVLDSSSFSDGDEWYILVNDTGSYGQSSSWSLYAGDIYVRDLGVLGAGFSANAAQTVGPEGQVFYKQNIGAGAPAWQLWLDGTSTNTNATVSVQKNAAAVASTHDTRRDKYASHELLLVPDYLTSDAYYVAVPGEPGDSVQLNSKIQPIQQISFTSTGNAGSIAEDGFGFKTFRVDVPVLDGQNAAWQPILESISGNAELYVRQGLIPNRWNNDALSESSTVQESVTLVPPYLTDGAWYITVFSGGDSSFELSSRQPEITDIAFINDPTPVANGAAHETRSGWRYFRVNDETIQDQVAAVGWSLENIGPASNYTIAVRRTAVPAIRYYRDDSTYIHSSNTYDASTTGSVLDRPLHEADVWYVGIHTQNEALGDFDLFTREFVPESLAFNAGVANVVEQGAGTWRYFHVLVPEDADGWDIHLEM